MIESGSPRLRPRRKVPFNRAKVVRLAKVVPGDQLDEVDLVAVLDHVLPSGHVQMIVAVEDRL